MAASHPEPPTKNAKDEYATFENALKRVLSVARSSIKSKVTAKSKKRSKISASRVASAKG